MVDGSPPDSIKLVVYVSGKSELSSRAITDAYRIVAACAAGEYRLEIVDIEERPKLVQERTILVTPVLERRSGDESRRAVGDLSEVEPVLRILGLDDRRDSGDVAPEAAQ